MIIVGAKGTAMELYSFLRDSPSLFKELRFFDDVNLDLEPISGQSGILKNLADAKEFMRASNDNNFILGLGRATYRELLSMKFSGIGGTMLSFVSPHAYVSKVSTTIGEGSTIFLGVTITSNVQIGRGVLININTSISHDTVIGDFCEIAPGVTITGRCTLGEKVFIGANATILPDITIGDNAIIGAGAVVTKNVKSNSTVMGVPAKSYTYD